MSMTHLLNQKFIHKQAHKESKGALYGITTSNASRHAGQQKKRLPWPTQRISGEQRGGTGGLSFPHSLLHCIGNLLHSGTALWSWLKPFQSRYWLYRSRVCRAQ